VPETLPTVIVPAASLAILFISNVPAPVLVIVRMWGIDEVSTVATTPAPAAVAAALISSLI